MKGTGSHSFCFHIRIARSYTHNRVKNLHMERHDDFPSARNQAASSQRSPNGKQNFLNNSRSVTSVGNSGRQLGSVFPRFRASIWRSCGQNACRDLLNQSAGSYWTTDATYCTGYVGPAKNNVEFFHFHTISKAGVNFHVFHDFHASGVNFVFSHSRRGFS
jgi:hypothetical protein